MDNLKIIEKLSSISVFGKKEINSLIELLCVNLSLDQYNNHHKLRDNLSKDRNYVDAQADFNFLNSV